MGPFGERGLKKKKPGPQRKSESKKRTTGASNGSTRWHHMSPCCHLRCPWNCNVALPFECLALTFWTHFSSHQNTTPQKNLRTSPLTEVISFFLFVFGGTIQFSLNLCSIDLDLKKYICVPPWFQSQRLLQSEVQPSCYDNCSTPQSSFISEKNTILQSFQLFEHPWKAVKLPGREF